ncbi:hypothetical protein GVAV_000952 [Gurleya vavrai]
MDLINFEPIYKITKILLNISKDIYTAFYSNLDQNTKNHYKKKYDELKSNIFLPVLENIEDTNNQIIEFSDEIKVLFLSKINLFLSRMRDIYLRRTLINEHILIPPRIVSEIFIGKVNDTDWEIYFKSKEDDNCSSLVKIVDKYICFPYSKLDKNLQVKIKSQITKKLADIFLGFINCFDSVLKSSNEKMIKNNLNNLKIFMCIVFDQNIILYDEIEWELKLHKNN